jgi:hypothetical protein
MTHTIISTWSSEAWYRTCQRSGIAFHTSLAVFRFVEVVAVCGEESLMREHHHRVLYADFRGAMHVGHSVHASGFFGSAT